MQGTISVGIDTQFIILAIALSIIIITARIAYFNKRYRSILVITAAMTTVFAIAINDYLANDNTGIISMTLYTFGRSLEILLALTSLGLLALGIINIQELFRKE